ncbi:hypothetical protein AAG906_003430 [Vitis piasezkii]
MKKCLQLGGYASSSPLGEMVGGSAMEALWEMIAQMEDILGEWPHEDGIVASWSYGEDIVVFKKVVLHGCSLGLKPSQSPSPEPKGFNGNKNVKELENLLWDMERFLRLLVFLMARRCLLLTPNHHLGDSKNELKDQFIPTNIAWVASESLKRFRHTRSVRDYVKEFSSLMLDIKNMLEEDKFFNFMQGVCDLPTAMVEADCLVDYKMGGAISTMQKPKLEGGRKAKAKGKAFKKSRWKKQNKKSVIGVKSMEKTTKLVQQSTRMAGCFICNGPHRARDCLKREKFSTLVSADDKGESDSKTLLESIHCNSWMSFMVRLLSKSP